ncbi:hypothetical protein GLOTRDRAFT_130772 [Gloeophyllum trabeum ATCC 11539]|uniref:Uncharacterized protein n=1 Tax=Gloeophyllum trabeum (strain ATCC 11539 / FP-39264 / Madison 617) TaxID=670483 RepID=S7RL92_GLOTA|nr:uncharacterized protein GLOTRDRAFT_130772 [Gloeophyllum trabeum ATCC 11539]EPQ53434.1 hypothetical protein GLOTRDRAFT_130772 [Gloeophyllum trabeum ATCC 11539]
MSASNAQPENAIPASTNPQRVRTVERWVVGGLIITCEETLAWVNRLRAARGDAPLEATRDDYCSLLLEIDERVKELHGYGCMSWGHPTDGGDVICSHVMVITRYDRARVPFVNGKATLTRAQTKSGPIERMAAKKLKEDERVESIGFQAFPSDMPPDC